MLGVKLERKIEVRVKSLTSASTGTRLALLRPQNRGFGEQAVAVLRSAVSVVHL